jgi:hypothetical protein
MEGRKVSHFGFSGRQRIIIRPGPHIIEVRYVRLERRIVETWDHDPSAAIVATVPVRSNGGVVLQFTAEAGHTYFIRDGRMGDIWRPRITEDRDPVFIEFDAPKAGPR